MRRWRWVILWCAAPAAAQEPPPVAPALHIERLGTLDPRLRETSGVALSRLRPDLVWTHNDSGDEPRLYAVTLAGATVATVTLAGAEALDWEDIAAGPCPAALGGHRACLFVGDIGDNDARRPSVTIYAVPEPELGGADDGERRLPARALHVRYADRPHDAEALTVDPAGRISIVTKGRDGAVLRYEIPAGAWTGGETVAAPADTLPIQGDLLQGRWVTGAAIGPDGLAAVVRTYTEIYRFEVGRRWRLVPPVCRIGLAEPLGEAIEFLPDGRLLLSNEAVLGSDPALTAVRCP